MYVPRSNEMPYDEARALVAAVGSAELITVDADGFPLATRLPVVWSGERLVCHMALANPHWRSIADGAPALAVVTGPEAYVSPSWYPAKAEHGRVVPTWNYTAVQLRGRATVHRDPEWLRAAVTELTDRHEQPRPEPWQVTDAPAPYVAGMLKAIVGIELLVEHVSGKTKLSQNRSEADRSGVIAGLRAEASAAGRAVADRMEDGLAAET